MLRWLKASMSGISTYASLALPSSPSSRSLLSNTTSASMTKTATHRPSCVCEVRNAAKAVPTASARGSRFALVVASSVNRPEKTRERTMLSAQISASFSTGVDGECVRTSANASSSSARCPCAARVAGGYCSISSSSSLHRLSRSKSVGSCWMYTWNFPDAPRCTSCSRFSATLSAHLFFSVSLAHSSPVQKSGNGRSASSSRTRHDARGSSTSTSPARTSDVARTPRYRMTVSSASPKYATSTFGDLSPLPVRHSAYSACCVSTSSDPPADATAPPVITPRRARTRVAGWGRNRVGRAVVPPRAVPPRVTDTDMAAAAAARGGTGAALSVEQRTPM
mmetsp:Transcript_16755/g.41259  ORF Transcript_16755/g.41259 Transcript_16755/m.41259 type:complete len:337 (-) Transcript_16755:132-1142(-)